MRVATVPTEVSYYSAVNALEKILKKADEDDMSRFSYWDFQRFLLMTMEIGRIIGMKDLKVTFTSNNA
jgi:hypothetical protein